MANNLIVQYNSVLHASTSINFILFVSRMIECQLMTTNDYNHNNRYNIFENHSLFLYNFHSVFESHD